MNRAFKGVFIPSEIWLDQTISPLKKMFLMEIYSLDSGKGCFAMNKHFSRITGSSTSAASNILKEMVKEGLIRIDYEDETARSGRKIISIHPSLACKEARKEGSVKEKGGSGKLRGGSGKLRGHKKEEFKEELKEPPIVPHGVDSEAWGDINEYRSNHKQKKIRDSWSDLAKKKTAKALAELPPEDQRRCVDETIMNGWQGIFPERLKQNEAHKRLRGKTTSPEVHKAIYEDIASSGTLDRSHLREDEITLSALMDEERRRRPVGH